MKKRVFGRKFSRERNSRIALFRGLIIALIRNGKIVTTMARAKAITGDIDKLVHLAKERDLAAARKIFAELGNDQISMVILTQKVAPVFSDRQSGFTRIIPLPPRRGDNAPMAKLEWVKEITESKKETKKKVKEVKKEK